MAWGSSRDSGAQVGSREPQDAADVSAGEYTSCFEAQGFRWELRQVVRVPLQQAEVARVPEKLSVSCATSSGFQLSCCIPRTYLDYTAAWSPEEGSQGRGGVAVGNGVTAGSFSPPGCSSGWEWGV